MDCLQTSTFSKGKWASKLQRTHLNPLMDSTASPRLGRQPLEPVGCRCLRPHFVRGTDHSVHTT